MAARGVAASFSAGYCAFGDEQGAPGVAGEAYPTYSRADIKARCGGASTWVTYKDGVYDITEFINAHPGGAQKIKLAAGGSVEPFWRIYRQHLEQQAGVMDLLAPMRVGTLSAEDYASETCAAKTVDADDPYGDEPERHPALIVHGATPMNAESPPALLGDTYLTPNDLWYCSGNRRGHMNQYGTTSGTAWGCGAASTATWAGVPLRDLVGETLNLGAAPLAAAKKLGLRHAIFEAADDMQASIPLEKALGELGDVLVAYEMNGAPIPRDHGGPLSASSCRATRACATSSG
ncbi:molybdenum ion binding protein [Aureococcus anophagefferens]|nr:molybdenum ion binding protein [Aureococcus anophagefferens]